MTNSKARPRLPEHVANAMTAILDYLWQDEASDYVSRNREEQEGHIFSELLTVRRWLNQREKPRATKEAKGAKSTIENS